MEGTELDPVTITDAFTKGISWTTDAMSILTSEPAIYFVAFAVVGAAAGVARKFVPMKRK